MPVGGSTNKKFHQREETATIPVKAIYSAQKLKNTWGQNGGI